MWPAIADALVTGAEAEADDALGADLLEADEDRYE